MPGAQHGFHRDNADSLSKSRKSISVWQPFVDLPDLVYRLCHGLIGRTR
jgi:hypothetical protein